MMSGAKWIAESDVTDKITAAPLLRKSFVLRNGIKSAVLYACGLGQAYYYINGTKITDEVMLTPISKYDTRVYIREFDVTDFLTEGKNAIGCVLGNGWYLVTYPRWDYYKPAWMHHPKLILKLVVEYEDGTHSEIVSGSSWKAAKSPILYNEDRRGEVYDARLYIDGWNNADFNDDEWKNAFICRGAGGVLERTDAPPIKVTRRLKGVKISDRVYDMGQNISGWVRIEVNGKRGAEVIIRYAEMLNDDGSIAPERLNTITGSATHTDKYILSGGGTEKWSPRFAYHGFRYAEITGDFDSIDVVGEVVHSAVEIIGCFECSNDMLNKIHAASVQSTLTNIQSVITDCPQREQNGWTGDALLSAEQSLMNFDMTAVYKKWLVDICDTQRPNGQICCIAPTGGWGYNWGSGPAWDSALILIPYYIYFYTGDKSVLANVWNNMKAYMRFIESVSDNNEVCFGLGDWCAPKGAEVCPTVITDTAYFYVDNKIMTECAEILGEDGAKYKKCAAEIKNSFREKYIKDDFYLGDNTTAIACAIYQGLYDEAEKAKAARRLNELYRKGGFRIDCGILGIKYLFTALSEYGYAETAYKLVTNPKCPSYAYWILNGMTTLCENWDMSDSCNHHMFSEVDMWFYKYIGGIRIDKGAKTAHIKPCLLSEIEWVRASHGGISVYYDSEKIEIESDIPLIYDDGENEICLEPGRHCIRKQPKEK